MGRNASVAFVAFVTWLCGACTGEAPPPATIDAAVDLDAEADVAPVDGTADAQESDAPPSVPDASDATSDRCPDVEVGARTGRRVAFGNTALGGDTFALSCDFDQTGTDVTFAITPDVTAPLFLRVEGLPDSTIAIFDRCGEGAVELACNEDYVGAEAALRFDAQAGVTYIVVVDGQVDLPGPFALHVERAERCDDGIDDDGDGFRDCADPDCASEPPCVEMACADGWDDDDDGRIDCGDPDCVTACFELLCRNGRDDDGNGLVDCRDPNCDLTCGGEPSCDDGIDENDNGLVDCADPRCEGDAACGTPAEVCFDGSDNDGDELVDCRDPDCHEGDGRELTVWWQCKEDLCDDGLDNQDDGRIDCEDRWCRRDPSCCPGSCATVDLGSRTGIDVARGDATLLCNSLTLGSCDPEDPRVAEFGGQDVSFTFTASETGVYEFDTLGSDHRTVLAVFDAASCADAARERLLGCDTDNHALETEPMMASVRVPLAAAQTVLVVIEVAPAFEAVGEYHLSIREL